MASPFTDVAAAPEGLALICDREGTIVRIVHDGIGVGDRVAVGAAWSVLFDAATTERATAFLADLQARQAVFDCRLPVITGGRSVPLRFAGAVAGDQLCLVAARSWAGLERISDELMAINNAQTNALRAALKDLSLQERQAARNLDSSLYADLTRLNNELTTLQREVVKKNCELEQLHAQKNRFIGMAAHDLRTPLGVILTYSEFLEDEAAETLNAEHREFVSIIKQTSQFMLALVNDLLDVSTIESGHLRLDRRPTDPGALIRRVVMLHQTLAAPKRVRVECHGGAPVPPLRLDADKIEQVLNNLIGNAVKFSEPDRAVRVAWETSDGGLVVSVADQGKGVPPDVLPQLFQPFSAAVSRGTAGEKGIGLGLAIARRIVQGHDGRIWVESEPGRGATFSFRLPFETDREDTAPTAASDSRG